MEPKTKGKPKEHLSPIGQITEINHERSRYLGVTIVSLFCVANALGAHHEAISYGTALRTENERFWAAYQSSILGPVQTTQTLSSKLSENHFAFQ